MPAPCQAVPPGQILALPVGVREEHVAQATKLCGFKGRKNCYAWIENGNLVGLPPSPRGATQAGVRVPPWD